MQTIKDIDPRLPAINGSLYRVAAKGVIIHDHKIMLVKEEAGYYSLPGGGIDYGESAQEALVRELQEEVGQTIPVSAVADTPFYVKVGLVIKSFPRVSMCYMINVPDSFTPVDNELSFIWATKEDLKSLYLSPQFDEMIEQIEF